MLVARAAVPQQRLLQLLNLIVIPSLQPPGGGNGHAQWEGQSDVHGKARLQLVNFLAPPPSRTLVTQTNHNRQSRSLAGLVADALLLAALPCLAELEPLQHKPTNRATHLRGLLRMPSCWSRASGATADGCSGADMSMEARTVEQQGTQHNWCGVSELK